MLRCQDAVILPEPSAAAGSEESEARAGKEQKWAFWTG